MESNANAIGQLVDEISLVNSFPKMESMPLSARRRVLQAAQNLIRAVQDPHETAFNLTMSSCVQAAIQSATSVGIFEAFSGKDAARMTAMEIAVTTKSSPELIMRIMRVLSANGIFTEQAPGSYTQNAVSQCFIKPPFSTWMLGTASRAWQDMKILPEYLASIHFRDPGQKGTDPSLAQYQTKSNLDYWSWLEKNPAQMEAYNKTMERSIEVARSIGKPGLASMYPFADELDGIRSSAEEIVLVDVGGGHGQALQDILTHAPSLQGRRMILQDRASTLKRHIICSSSPTIESLPHDFFQPQPIKGALAYLFRHVLHDWPDEQALAILRQTTPALERGKSRILVAERVLPDMGCSQVDANWDLIMMRHLGRERTESQWHEMLLSAGLRVEKIWPFEGEERVIEAVLI